MSSRSCSARERRRTGASQASCGSPFLTYLLSNFSSFFRFDSVQQELNKFSSQNKELQREMERLQSEVTRYKNLQLKSAKDCEKYKEERDSVFNEYRLIMSERDQVIKEVDKLQTELESAEARLKNTSSERVVASEELEALRQVSAALGGASLEPERF